MDDSIAIGIYIFNNLIYSLAAYPMGIWADKWGMKRVYIGGLIIFAVVYAGMAYADSAVLFFVLFFLYGVYAAATEGIAKAWISNLTDAQNTATAIGTYTAFQSVLTLVASTLAGVIWMAFGASATFILTAVITLAVVIYLHFFYKE